VVTALNATTVLDKEYGLYINGQWVKGSEGKLISSYNPSNGEKLADFVDATYADVDQAVAAAAEALKTWKKVSLIDRSNLLLKIADLIDEHAEKLALVETLDNGKPLRETRNIDVPLSSDHFRYFAGVIRSEEGTAQAFDEDTLSISIKEPIGVVGQIIPWNFPLLMAAWKIAPAIAAGNTVVIHPSSTTSLSLLELAKIFDQVLPNGVVNVITGRGSHSGDYMLHHEGFAKIAFTGSTEIGQEVAVAAAKRLIPSTLELGGKSANIIFNDAPMERALEGVQLGILFNQGQVCCAGSRIFIQEGIYEEFLAKMKLAFEDVKVGLPWEEDVVMGAQINERQLEQILEYVKIGEEEGARVVTGGCRLINNGLENGAFMAPTILADATNDMRIAQEEIFGPVLAICKVPDWKTGIKVYNDTDYGLTGSFFSTKEDRIEYALENQHCGNLYINKKCTGALVGVHPFGGFNMSGTDSKAGGFDYLLLFTQAKLSTRRVL